MRFADNNYNIYKSVTKKDLVVELYKTSFARVYAKDADDWCNQCAARIFEQHGHRLEFNDADTFVNELIKYKLIMEIN